MTFLFCALEPKSAYRLACAECAAENTIGDADLRICRPIKDKVIAKTRSHERPLFAYMPFQNQTECPMGAPLHHTQKKQTYLGFQAHSSQKCKNPSTIAQKGRYVIKQQQNISPVDEAQTSCVWTCFANVSRAPEVRMKNIYIKNSQSYHTLARECLIVSAKLHKNLNVSARASALVSFFIT